VDFIDEQQGAAAVREPFLGASNTRADRDACEHSRQRLERHVGRLGQ